MQQWPAAGLTRADTLIRELRQHGVAQFLDQGLHGGCRLLGQRLQECLLPRGEHCGETDAVGREQAGEGMDQVESMGVEGLAQ